MGDEPSLDDLITILRTTPAQSAAVEEACRILAWQVRYGKISEDEVHLRLRQVLDESDAGANAKLNIDRASAAAFFAACDAPHGKPIGRFRQTEEPYRSVLVDIAVIIGFVIFLILGPLRHLDFWWKVLLSPLAAIAFAVEVYRPEVVPVQLPLLILLLVGVWWWPLSALALGWKVLLSVISIALASYIGTHRDEA